MDASVDQGSVSASAAFIVYRITCSVNGKRYIGITTRGLLVRWEEHCRAVAWKSALSNAIKKHGRESFSVEIVDSARSFDELCALESEWIRKENTLSPNGYNLTVGGEGTPFPSAETRTKMSAAAKRRGLSAATRAAISAANRARVFTAEDRAKFSAANKARALSEESRGRWLAGLKNATESNRGRSRRQSSKDIAAVSRMKSGFERNARIAELSFSGLEASEIAMRLGMKTEVVNSTLWRLQRRWFGSEPASL